MAQETVLSVFTNITLSVPNYQRDYAWDVKNIDELWEDLIDANENASDVKGHFLGTIVVSPNPKENQVYDIIDGQQRSTTLFMLRYALNQKTDEPNYRHNHFYERDGSLKLRVAPNNQIFFKKVIEQAKSGKIDLLLKKECETKAQERIFNVFQAIFQKVNLLSSKEAESLLQTLEKMILLKLEEENSGRAIRLFQTVNDRGVDLGIMDKLKALLILYSNKYCNGVLDDLISESFGEIFKILEEITESKAIASLGDKKFEEEVERRIFNYHSHSYEGIGHYRYGADESYSNLKKFLIEMKNDSNKLEKWLNEYTLDLLGFTKSFLNLLEQTKTNLELFRLFFVLKINPFFYSSLVRLEMNGLLDEEILRLFAQAEIIFYTLGSTNDSRAFKLRSATESKEKFIKQLIKDIHECNKGSYASVKSFLKEISKDNHDWKGFHYLYFVYHNVDIQECWEILENKKTLDLTQEHIISQNTSNNGTLKDHGFEDEDDFEDYLHDFGNLISLEESLNKSLQDAGLVIKQREYKKSKILANASLANRKDFLSFGKQQIIEENEKFCNWANNFFSNIL